MASVYFHGKSKLSFCLAILIEFVIATICIAADIQSINLTTTKMICVNRNNAFKEDEGAWKGEGDGKVVNNQPQRVMMDGQQMMASGYIGKYV